MIKCRARARTREESRGDKGYIGYEATLRDLKKHTKYVGNNADLWEYVIILYPLEEFFMYVFGC